jgi:hypothetical protein
MAKPVSYEAYLAQIHALGGIREPDPAVRAMVEAAVAALTAGPIERDRLASLIREHPEWVRILGLVVGLTQEGLRNTLTTGFGRSSWVPLARSKPNEVVAYLDDTLALLDRLRDEASRSWTFADVLVERASSSTRASGAIARGRALEDLVQGVVAGLGLPHGMRGRFEGRAGQLIPCDLAIPNTGGEAQIVVAIKGFDSTGSKLTDAVREIEQAAEWRLPTQYVYAVVDGGGWLRRQGDLRRIHALWARRSIDGLYTASTLGQFRIDVAAAAEQAGIQPSTSR